MESMRDEDIAIIGLSGRFPGAKTIDAFWDNLCAGRETIHRFTDDELRRAGIDEAVLNQPNYVKAKGMVDEVAYFDAAFFGLSSLEAKLLDPQHRMLLLCAWEALENAAQVTKKNKNRVGLFASTGMSFYLLKNILANQAYLQNTDEYQLLLSHDKDFLATRISYLLNLQGPSINVQTGCSSSLVAVHYACQSLLNGECDMALAGGVSITIPQEQGYLYKKEMIGSPDGHCYAFDQRAQGTVKSNGAGMVLLKPLADALRDQDTIYAVIRGTAVNNDGANKVGYTAPSVSQQAAVIKEALQMADVDPHHIEYIETHGTGTLLGDPIEISALTQAFSMRKGDVNTCALTSLKTNLGHLDVAAGIASLIKASLAVYHGKIPASLNFSELNPKINLTQTPFYINTQLKEWQPKHASRCAGVSAFGIGGTNVHVVIQEAPQRMADPKPLNERQLLLFSAKSKLSLEGNIKKLITHLACHPAQSLADVAYTLQSGREAMPYKVAFAINRHHDLQDQLAEVAFESLTPTNQPPPIVFMFSGQGSQYPGMAADLYATDTHFKSALDACLAALRPHMHQDLRECLFPLNKHDETAHHRLKQTEMAQPALFAIEYALAQAYLARGVMPKAVVGHSVGEYVAAVMAGIFSLEDAARLIAMRGQLIQRLPAGSMLAVYLSEAQVAPLLPRDVDIALINSPMVTVVSGPSQAVSALSQRLTQLGIRYQPLHTSHAFHSNMLDEVLDEFAAMVASVKRTAPTLAIASNVTGDWMKAEEACSVHYWVQQLRKTVRFAQCVATIQHSLSPLFIEVGPGRTLQSLVYQQGITRALNSLPSASEEENSSVFMNTLAELWQAGVRVQAIQTGKRIPLPTYAWDLQRYWIEPDVTVVSEKVETVNEAQPDVDIKSQLQSAWFAVLGVEVASDEDNFFSLGGNSFAAIQLINRLPTAWQERINVVHLYQYPKFIQFLRFIQSLSSVVNNNVMSPDSQDERQLFSEQGEL